MFAVVDDVGEVLERDPSGFWGRECACRCPSVRRRKRARGRRSGRRWGGGCRWGSGGRWRGGRDAAGAGGAVEGEARRYRVRGVVPRPVEAEARIATRGDAAVVADVADGDLAAGLGDRPAPELGDGLSRRERPGQVPTGDGIPE